MCRYSVQRYACRVQRIPLSSSRLEPRERSRETLLLEESRELSEREPLSESFDEERELPLMPLERSLDRSLERSLDDPLMPLERSLDWSLDDPLMPLDRSLDRSPELACIVLDVHERFDEPDAFDELESPIVESIVCESCFDAELPRSSSFWLPRSVRLPSEEEPLIDEPLDGEPLALDVPPKPPVLLRWLEP